MARLSINGGERAVTLEQDESLTWPLIGEEDKKRVIKVLDMGSGIAGWYTEAYRFEEEFRNYIGAKYEVEDG